MEGSIGFIGELAGEITGEGSGGVTPDITATAQVDSNTGTPTVTVTRTGPDENPNFNFFFQNLKGEQGVQGVQGIQGLPGSTGPTGPQGPRGFTGATGATGPQGPSGASPTVTASATVDSSIGTPSVSVVKSGTELAPNFAFAFHNLKGAQGETGSQGIQGPQGETGPAGPGIASGGSVGQILYKNGAGDYLTDWEDNTAGIVFYDNTDSGMTANDVQAAINELKALISKIKVYGPGTYTFTGLYCYGFVTSSAKSLRLCFPLNIEDGVNTVSDISISSWSLRIPTGGYITYTSGTTNSGVIQNNSQIEITADSSTAYGNAVNNTPIAGFADITFKLSIT